MGDKVRENNIRTAVVSRKTRTECKNYMKSKGVSVDVVIGGKDLDTRFTHYGKPQGVPMAVAAAMMYLDPSDVIVFGDYSGDLKSSEAAGMDYCSSADRLMSMLGKCENREKIVADYSEYKVPTTGIIGAICGDVIGSAYEFYPTDDYNFEPFVKRTHVTDDSVATLAVASWLM